LEIINLLHSFTRWGILIFAIICIVNSLVGILSKKEFTKKDNLLSIIFVSLCDTQLLTGMLQYLLGPWGIKNIQNQGMANVMRDGYSRFFAIEHIIMMLIALVIIHIGRAKSKKSMVDLAKHKTIFWFFMIALIIILISIPWPIRKGFEGLGWI
jgi:hypothetical protein